MARMRFVAEPLAKHRPRSSTVHGTRSRPHRVPPPSHDLDRRIAISETLPELLRWISGEDANTVGAQGPCADEEKPGRTFPPDERQIFVGRTRNTRPSSLRSPGNSSAIHALGNRCDRNDSLRRCGREDEARRKVLLEGSSGRWWMAPSEQDRRSFDQRDATRIAQSDAESKVLRNDWRCNGASGWTVAFVNSRWRRTSFVGAKGTILRTQCAS